MSTEVHSGLLQVFRRKRWICIHELIEATGISYNQLNKSLVKLEVKGHIQRSQIEGSEKLTLYGLVNFDTLYQPTEGTELHPSHDMSKAGLCSPVVGMTEQDARSRVFMLKRMKERLIQEWHPIIDKIIEDYQRDLRRVEAERDFILGTSMFECGD